jgi:hypothetical protein
MGKGFFAKYLLVRCLPKEVSRFRFEVFREFEYVTMVEGFQGTIRVPVGFKTDFASTPWFTRAIFPPTGRYNEAAVVHDYLCFLSNRRHHSKETRKKLRKYADSVFIEAMEVLRVKKWKRWTMWKGVALFTWWKKGKIADT